LIKSTVPKSDFYQKVLAGEIEIQKVYEDDLVLAFYHTKPSFRFHVVIIPKTYFQDATAIDDEIVLLRIFQAVKQIAAEFNFETQGLKLITNMGIFQDSDFLRFHLIDNMKI
jgi:histidine triad (HIT) family protein